MYEMNKPTEPNGQSSERPAPRGNWVTPVPRAKRGKLILLTLVIAVPIAVVIALAIFAILTALEIGFPAWLIGGICGSITSQVVGRILAKRYVRKDNLHV